MIFFKDTSKLYAHLIIGAGQQGLSLMLFGFQRHPTELDKITFYSSYGQILRKRDEIYKLMISNRALLVQYQTTPLTPDQDSGGEELEASTISSASASFVNSSPHVGEKRSRGDAGLGSPSQKERSVPAPPSTSLCITASSMELSAQSITVEEGSPSQAVREQRLRYMLELAVLKDKMTKLSEKLTFKE